MKKEMQTSIFRRTQYLQGFLDFVDNVDNVDSLPEEKKNYCKKQVKSAPTIKINIHIRKRPLQLPECGYRG